MASYDFNRPNFFPSIQPFTKTGTAEVTPTLKKFFLQRAWNTVGQYFETWISEGAPQATPPSGDVVTGLTTSAFWKEVV
jgi:hypothetical protein